MYSAYDPTNAVILVSRIMVLICVIFSTPLLHYPVRICSAYRPSNDSGGSSIGKVGLVIARLLTVGAILELTMCRCALANDI